MDKPLIIQPVKSGWLGLVIILSHGLVFLFVVLLLGASVLVSVLLIAMIGFSFFYYYRLHVLKCYKYSILQARHHLSDNANISAWTISLTQQEKAIGVSLLPSSYLSNFIIILCFQDKDRQNYSLLVMKDSVDHTCYRQLKVRLKLLQAAL